jgi:hypothetical protein
MQEIKSLHLQLLKIRASAPDLALKTRLAKTRTKANFINTLPPEVTATTDAPQLKFLSPTIPKVASLHRIHHGLLLLPNDPNRGQTCVSSLSAAKPVNFPRKGTNFLLKPAFNHSQSADAEAEYDRLRDLARQEAGKRSSCFDKVEIPSCYTLEYTRADIEARHTKHTSAAMALRRISCRKRESSMRRRWISTISRPLIISSGRTMRRDELRTIRLIYMGSL